jgi:tRNA(fMet)-specific endonuclease VapC
MAKRQKKNVLIDTCIWIELFEQNPVIVQQCLKIGEENLVISPIIKAELFVGATNKEELKIIRRKIRNLTNYEIDISTSQKFGELVYQYALSHRIGLPDAMIAATAIVNSLEFYTLNIVDFNFIQGLKLYKAI